MPSDDPELKAVEDRLGALVRCILAKAEADPEFAGQLKELFLSDTLRLALRSKGSKKGRRAVFDLVGFLSQHGLDVLRRELTDKPTSELAEVARQHKVIPQKVIKSMDRDELIEKLVAHAERKLSQGGVFLRGSNCMTLGPS
jgi:hypothetical protein